ncbi:MAG: hypothetical protein JO149_03120 [Gammaproteobacteria bacterium]|nr:hypothetical protein [Gammaproteobacteria bacterium]
MTSLYAFIRQERFLYFFAAIASVLLSLWLYSQETVINPDAICYLLSAENIATAGIRGAMQLCGQAQWPFYSAFIYGLAQILPVSYQTSAYLLDSFFSLLSVLTFILIVKELGGCKRTLWLAAGVILLAHQFNDVRESIIRDHGFWAFYLASFFFLLRYFHHPRYLTACAFNLSLLIAALFRIEGFIFLAILPFLALFASSYTWRERLQHFFSLASFPILMSMMLSVYLLLHPQAIAKLGRLADLTYQVQHGLMAITARFLQMKTALAHSVLTTDSVNDASSVLILVFIAWYALSVISNLSLLSALLVIYAWRNKVPALSRSAFLVLSGYISINLLVTFLFLVERVFLSNRYLLALSLVLMLWVPFALNALFKERRHLFVLAAILMCLTSLGGVVNFGHSKAYIRSAGDWLAANVPSTANLYVNDYQLMYYSQHFGKRIFAVISEYQTINAMKNAKWKHYDYLALRLNAKEKLPPINLTPIQIFRNKRDDRVEIYRVTSK